MIPPLTFVSGQPEASLRFVCVACGTNLVVADSQRGVSGPCPKCNTWIEASEFKMQAAPAKVLESRIPSQGASRKRRSVPPTAGRGSIRADGYLDHEHNEKRELITTLRILAVFLAVSAVILFITLYMKQWMLK